MHFFCCRYIRFLGGCSLSLSRARFWVAMPSESEDLVKFLNEKHEVADDVVKNEFGPLVGIFTRGFILLDANRCLS